MSSDRESRGRWGYSSRFMREGLVIVAHNAKSTSRPSAPFHLPATNKKPAGSVGAECTVRGKHGGRADEETDKCEGETVEKES